VLVFCIVNLIIYYYKKHYSYLINPSTDNSMQSIENNELRTESSKLRFKYLFAYLCTRASVWSKSPYLYTMYSKYHGFSIDEIGLLYVIDAVTALISGPFLGNLADKYGRKLFCVNYCILVITNLSLRVTGNKTLAYLAQILTGLGAGLIMITFESWVNFEAKKVFKENEYEKDKFLKKLFKSQSILDALTSLFVTSITAIAYSRFGILFPIGLSIFFASMAMSIILIFWDENKPNTHKK
jgi:MFS family permease